jgi:hypothetical protein
MEAGSIPRDTNEVWFLGMASGSFANTAEPGTDRPALTRTFTVATTAWPHHCCFLVAEHGQSGAGERPITGKGGW